MKSTKIFIVIFCSTVSSCSNSDTVMAPYEKKLELNGTTTRSFHSMLYYPSGIALHSPGYIIGVEKSPIRIIGGPNEINPLTKNNRKSMFISHIIKNDFNVINVNSATPYITSNYCFVYNSYISKELVDKSNVDMAKISGWNACDISSSITDANDAKLYSFYKNSDVGLIALRSNLKHDLKSGAYSHILIIVMGWNTSQSDAIRNFNDITGNIITASLKQRDDVKENPSSPASNMLIPRVRVIKPSEKK